MSSFRHSQHGREVCLFSDANSLGGKSEGEETLRPLIVKSIGPAPVLNSPVPRMEGAGGFRHCANHRTRFLVSRSGSPSTRNQSVMTPEGGELTTICWSHLHPQWSDPKQIHPWKTYNLDIYIVLSKSSWQYVSRPLKQPKPHTQ